MAALDGFQYRPGHAGPVLESRVDALRDRLSLVQPDLLAARSGASYLELGQGRGEFHLALLDTSLVITYPDFRVVTVSGEAISGMKQALLMYYLITSDGAPLTGRWISFADLPDGRVYATAFQGYTGDVISHTFHSDLDSFRLACQAAGGHPVSLGDSAFRFSALPRIDLLAVYHLGDEDFPSACKILFDAGTAHCLPTEACAILGNMLTQKILRSQA